MSTRYVVSYGELVRCRLGELGWSDREVAAKTDGALSHTIVGEIRRHGYVPSAERVVALALALGDDPNEHLRTAEKPSHLRYVRDGELDGGGEESAGDNGCFTYQTFVGRLAGAC
jgi:hypothetical protein